MADDVVLIPLPSYPNSHPHNAKKENKQTNKQSNIKLKKQTTSPNQSSKTKTKQPKNPDLLTK